MRSSRPHHLLRSARCRRSRLLAVEQLEDRALLATLALNSGVLQYLATSGVANNVTISQSEDLLTITDTAETIDLSQELQDQGFQGHGTHTVFGPAREVYLETADETDTILVQSPGLTVPVTVSNPGGRTDLTVDHSGDRTGLLNTGINENGINLGPATVFYNLANLQSLTIKGGNGGASYYVYNTPAAIPTTLCTGAGPANVVNVRGTTGPLEIKGQGGRDRVNVGSPRISLFGDLQLPVAGWLGDLVGPVTVRNEGGFTDLHVNDTFDLGLDLDSNGDPSRKPHLTSVAVEDRTLGAIQRMAPAEIRYDPKSLGSLVLVGALAGNTFTVDGTGAGFRTIIESLSSADQVQLNRTTGPLEIVQLSAGVTVTAADEATNWRRSVFRGPANFGATAGTIADPHTEDVYVVNLPEAPTGGTLTLGAEAAAGSELDARLALLNPGAYMVYGGFGFDGSVVVDNLFGLAGGVLASSDDRGPGMRDAELSEYVLPGRYFVKVSSAVAGAGGSGAYQLSLSYDPGSAPAPVHGAGPRVGSNPQDLLAADFNDDDAVDLATANYDSGDVSVVLGNGDGTFQPDRRFALSPGSRPDRLLAKDFNADGRLDLAALDSARGVVDILLGLGNGLFHDRPLQRPATDPLVAGLFAGPSRTTAETDNARNTLDFNRDGSPDRALLAASGQPGQHSSQLTIEYSLAFLDRTLLDHPAISYGGVEGPLRPQLIGQREAFRTGSGTGNGPQLPELIGGFFAQELAFKNDLFQAAANNANPSRATPLIADLTGDGVNDVVTVSRSGQVLLRAGRRSEPGAFEPPVVVNSGAGDPGAREVAIVATGAQAQLAALSLNKDEVVVYSATHTPGTGQVSWQRTFSGLTGLFPVRVAAGDLDGDGRPDLVIANGQQPNLTIYLNDAGSFTRIQEVPLGLRSPSEILLINRPGRRHADIVVTDVEAGDVKVLRNQGLPAGMIGFDDALHVRAATFEADYQVVEIAASNKANQLVQEMFLSRFPTPEDFAQLPFIRSGGFLSPLQQFPGRFPGAKFLPPLFAPISPLQTSAAVAGDFVEDGVADLVVLNRGANSIALLQGKFGAPGQFIDPQAAQIFAAGDEPTAAATGDFNGDGYLDLAVLNAASHDVWVCIGDGRGALHHAFTVDAGDTPTGLSARDINGDKKLDLLVGNIYGDVLRLMGQGNGEFRPPNTTQGRITLAAGRNGAGSDVLILSNQSRDRVSIQEGASADPALFQDRSAGLLAPGPVEFADLDGDGERDLVVANTGGNELLVYLGQGSGQFAAQPQRFAVGTNPMGLAIGDLNEDGIPDVAVTNQGSNDVSVLLGQRPATGWTMVHGPRLNAGGVGPVSAVVEDATQDGRPDLLVANSQSNTVAILPGLGNGFFNDLAPRLLPTGQEPRQVLVAGRGSSGPVVTTVNRGSNNLTFLSNLSNAAIASRDVPSGGSAPIAARAGDFNHDGQEDLLVAHEGDGVVSRLLGQQAAAPLAEILLAPGPEQFSDLATVTDATGTRVYGVTFGNEQANLLFVFGIPAIQAAGAVGGDSIIVATPLPLGPSSVTSLPIAAILLTVGEQSLPLTDLVLAGEALETSASLAEQTGAADTGSLLTSLAGGGDEGQTDEDGEQRAEATTKSAPSLDRLVLGLEEALQRATEEARKDLLPGNPSTGNVARLRTALDAVLKWGATAWQKLAELFAPSTPPPASQGPPDEGRAGPENRDEPVHASGEAATAYHWLEQCLLLAGLTSGLGPVLLSHRLPRNQARVGQRRGTRYNDAVPDQEELA